MSDVKVCVFSMIKNGRTVVERMLRSTLPWMSRFVLVDDASTDGTADVASAFCVGHGVEFSCVKLSPKTHPDLYRQDVPESYGKFCEVDFPGPFSGRQMLVRWGTARNLGWKLVPDDGWVLVLDADDEVMDGRAISSDVEHAMTAGASHVVGRYLVGDDLPARRRLIFDRKASGDWRGQTHEVLVPSGKEHDGQITVRDHRDNVGDGVRIENRTYKIGYLTCQDAGWLDADVHDLACLVQDMHWNRHPAAARGLDLLRMMAHGTSLLDFVERNIARHGGG